MSKSFKIVNGDLQVGTGRSFEIVKGSEKLIQDLKLWVLERVGADRLTPTFGSTLDGGIIDGEGVAPLIGEVYSLDVINELRGELTQLVQRYQQLQLSKIQAEALQFSGRHTLSEDETIDTIEQVDVVAVGTTLIARVAITTLAGQELRVTLPLAGGTNG